MKPYSYIAIMAIVLAMACKDDPATSSKTNRALSQDPEYLEVTQEQFEQSGMQLDTITEKPFSQEVTVNGVIDVPPEYRAVVHAKMGGYIQDTPLVIGDNVTKGQVLARIGNQAFISLQQAYLETHETLAFLKAEYDRQTTMKRENITSEKNYLKAASAYKSAMARHKGLEQQLLLINIPPAQVRAGHIVNTATIRAPISGSITKINMTKGTYADPQRELLEIINNEHLHLELSVFEKDIMKIKKGQDIRFTLPEDPATQYTAHVHLVGRSIDTDRTVKVHAHLTEETTMPFITGMFVTAKITIETQMRPALPSTAVVTIAGRNKVLVLDRKEDTTYYFEQRDIPVNGTYQGYSSIEQTDSFKAGSLFLTKGAFLLLGE